MHKQTVYNNQEFSCNTQAKVRENDAIECV